MVQRRKRSLAIGPASLCGIFLLLSIWGILGKGRPPLEQSATGGSEYQLQSWTESGDGYRIYAEIPITGKDGVDVSLRAQINALVDAFILRVNADKPQSPYQLRVQCDIWSSGKSVVSVLFSAYSYMGGGGGKSAPLCKTYDMETGNPLLLTDLFEDMEKGLERLAVICLAQYTPWIEEKKTDLEWLSLGLSRDPNHYEAFAVTPEGLRIFFSPYQLGPWQTEIEGFTISYDQLKDLFSEKFLAVLLEEEG